MILMKENPARDARTAAQNLCRVAGAALLSSARLFVGEDVVVCAAPALNDFIFHATNRAGRLRSTHVHESPLSLR
jgi:hypothetical protein